MTSRLERKLVIPPQSAGLVVAWLRHDCVVDTDHPLNLVTSLYFDTADLDSYHECVNGDVYKDKVRIRWYDRLVTNEEVAAYVEIKSKRGSSTVKRRTQIRIPGKELMDRGMTHVGDRLGLARTLLEAGCVPDKRLIPMIVISYWRYRFREREGDVSLTYDLGITSSMAERSISASASRLALQTTVLEIKGGTMGLPRAVRRLRGIPPRWSAFSKYAKCLEAHLERPGSSGWLRP